MKVLIELILRTEVLGQCWGCAWISLLSVSLSRAPTKTGWRRLRSWLFFAIGWRVFGQRPYWSFLMEPLHGLMALTLGRWKGALSWRKMKHANAAIRSCHFVHVSSFIPITHVNLIQFGSFYSFQLAHVNSLMAIHSFQFMRFKSLILIDSCLFTHFISFQFTSFQVTAMTSYKPCLFFETSAPARAGHYLRIIRYIYVEMFLFKYV